MAPTNLLLLPALLLLTSAHAQSTHTTAPAATLPLYPAFIHLPTPPAVLDATLLSAAPAPTGTGSAVFEWSVDCPSGDSEANDACRDLSVFPAEVSHTQNGGWRGKMVGKKGVTTVWSCDLTGDATGGAHCVDILSTKGGKEVTTTQMLGCHGDRQLVPLRISEGAEKLPEGWEGVLMGELNAQYGGGLEEGTECRKTWTMQSGAPIVTGNVTSTAPTRTATTTTGTGVTGTSVGDVVASQTGEGAGVRMGVSGGLLVVGAVAAVWFGA